MSTDIFIIYSLIYFNQIYSNILDFGIGIIFRVIELVIIHYLKQNSLAKTYYLKSGIKIFLEHT